MTDQTARDSFSSAPATHQKRRRMEQSRRNKLWCLFQQTTPVNLWPNIKLIATEFFSVSCILALAHLKCIRSLGWLLWQYAGTALAGWHFFCTSCPARDRSCYSTRVCMRVLRGGWRIMPLMQWWRGALRNKATLTHSLWCLWAGKNDSRHSKMTTF